MYIQQLLIASFLRHYNISGLFRVGFSIDFPLLRHPLDEYTAFIAFSSANHIGNAMEIRNQTV